MNKQQDNKQKDFKHHAKDTGSVAVQVVALSQDIRALTKHFKNFPKDKNGKRGMMVKVGQRTAFLNYLKRKNKAQYQQLVDSLEIR